MYVINIVYEVAGCVPRSARGVPGESAVYIRKTIGPSTEPCGTQCATGDKAEVDLGQRNVYRDTT